MAINNAPLPNSCISPFFLNYGFHPCCEADLFNLHAPAHDLVEDLPAFLQRIHRDWCAAHEVMLCLSEDTKVRIDERRRPTEISVGAQVLINLWKHPAHTLWPDRGPLMPYFAGPFEVLRRVGTNAYQLQLTPAMVTAHVHDVFNVSQLRLFHSDTPLLDARDDAQPPDDGAAPEHDAQWMLPAEPEDHHALEL